MPRVASEREQEAASENTIFYPIIECSEILRYRPYRKGGLTTELHFSVAGYGGLHLPFSGITQYLRTVDSVYDPPIIAGVRILIVSSTCSLLPWCAAYRQKFGPVKSRRERVKI